MTSGWRNFCKVILMILVGLVVIFVVIPALPAKLGVGALILIASVVIFGWILVSDTLWAVFDKIFPPPTCVLIRHLVLPDSCEGTCAVGTSCRIAATAPYGPFAGTTGLLQANGCACR